MPEVPSVGFIRQISNMAAPVRWLGVLLAISTLLACGSSGIDGSSAEPPSGTGDGGQACSAASLSEEFTNNQKATSCATCHGNDGSGGIGVNLQNFASFDVFESAVREGRAGMPAYTLDEYSEAAMNNDFAFLGNESCQGQVVEVLPSSVNCESRPASLTDTFDFSCAGCHSQNGTTGNDLTAIVSLEYFTRVVREGVPNPMPSFSPAEYSDEDLQSDFAFLSFDQRCAAPAPEKLSNPLKRQSVAEYQYAIKDLFSGIGDLPEMELPQNQAIEGFENHWETLAPSELLIYEYWQNSRKLVEFLDGRMDQVLPCDRAEGESCARTFINEFASRAYRRPLTDEEFNGYFNLYDDPDSREAFTISTQLFIQSVLMSANFLYRPEFGEAGELTGLEIASRLSFLLWKSLPDGDLLNAAQSGQLTTAEGLETQVDRMLSDPRAERGVREFFRQWLKVDAITYAKKEEEDEFTAEVRSALHESVLLYTWHELFEKNLPITELLNSNIFYVNNQIDHLFGVDSPGEAFQAMDLGDNRKGFLTHPVFLASHAYGFYPSPVLRGVFILDRMLCNASPPPPPDAGTSPLVLDPNIQTNRELFQRSTTDLGADCAACHNIINPLGFAFENFDALGQFREFDNGVAVDASGASSGFEFANGVELSAGMAESNAFKACMQKKLIAFSAGGWNLGEDAALNAEIAQLFESNNFRTRDIIKAIAMNEKISRLYFGLQ